MNNGKKRNIKFHIFTSLLFIIIYSYATTTSNRFTALFLLVGGGLLYLISNVICFGIDEIRYHEGLIAQGLKQYKNFWEVIKYPLIITLIASVGYIIEVIYWYNRCKSNEGYICSYELLSFETNIWFTTIVVVGILQVSLIKIGYKRAYILSTLLIIILLTGIRFLSGFISIT